MFKYGKATQPQGHKVRRHDNKPVRTQQQAHNVTDVQGSGQDGSDLTKDRKRLPRTEAQLSLSQWGASERARGQARERARGRVRGRVPSSAPVLFNPQENIHSRLLVPSLFLLRFCPFCSRLSLFPLASCFKTLAISLTSSTTYMQTTIESQGRRAPLAC